MADDVDHGVIIDSPPGRPDRVLLQLPHLNIIIKSCILI